jgi:hypothetical protein
MGVLVGALAAAREALVAVHIVLAGAVVDMAVLVALAVLVLMACVLAV